jgi:serine/threonine protein kinase
MLEALRYIHSRGIIHDDIKLDNLLMETAEREDEYNKIKVCDFGLSQICSSNGKA